MVKRILGMLSKEVGNIHHAAYLIGFFAVLSQLLGLFRDRLFAYYFGAGQVLDVYYTSFKIPDFIFVSVASFVSISVLVPFVVERLKGDTDVLRNFIGSLFSFFSLLMVGVSIIAYVLTPWLVHWLFPGISAQESYDQLVLLTRIALLSPILLGLSNLFASITQACKRFIIYAISPLLYNFGIIVGIVIFYPMIGIAGLAWGVVLGALMHLLIQLPFVYSHGLMPRLQWKFDFSSIKEIVLLSAGRTVALSSSTIATVVLLGFGSLMSIGSIAVFNFSWNMQSVPLAIVGVSYSIALFPTISRFFSTGERAQFVEAMLTAARHIVFWSVPISALFVVLRAQIVRTILGSGNFSWSNTRLVAAALAVFSVSVVAQSLVLLFIRAYYASGRTKTPLLVNVFSGMVAIASSYGLWKLFLSWPVFRFFVESLLRVEGIPGTEVIMLPLGYSISMLLNLALFWYVFHREAPGFTRRLLRVFFQNFAGAMIMAVVAYLSLQWLSSIFDLNTVLGIFAQGFFAGILGIIAGVIVLRALESQELKEVWGTLHAKIWNTKVIVSETDVLP